MIATNAVASQHKFQTGRDQRNPFEVEVKQSSILSSTT